MLKRVVCIFLVLILSNSIALAFPNPPGNVMATDGNTNSITVTWSLPTTGDAVAAFFLYRSSAYQPCEGEAIASIGNAETSFVDTSFPNLNVFYYSLRSVNAQGEESNCSATDSGYATGFPPPAAPDPVVASDNLLDKIAVSWTLPSNSQPVNSLTLYRTEMEGLKFCNADPSDAATEDFVMTDLEANATSFDDLSAAPGVPYFYALKAVGQTGISNCSSFPDSGRRLLPPPPNPPINVMATDGTFTDKIGVTWNPPVSGGVVTNYKLHRSTIIGAGCTALHIDSIPAAQSSLDDTIDVIPGVQYYYWMQSVGPDGTSECSVLDPGHARINAPTSVQATDGTFPDKVVVTWVPPSSPQPVTGFDLFRDTSPTACTSLLTSNLGAGIQTYDDLTAVPGVVYYYSVTTKSATGDSFCSNIDPGHALTECSDGLDNDGDGTIDAAGDPGCTDVYDDDENDPNLVCDDGLDNDGDNKIDFQVDRSGDPGCDSPEDPDEEDKGDPLKSPAFAKFNTFLGQWNFAELVNQGDQDKEVKVVVYNLRGEVMITRTIVVPAESEVDIDVNGLVQFACDVLNQGCQGFEDLSATRGDNNGLGRPDGIVDTYGLVSFIFDDSDPDQQLLGRISFYRPNADGSFSFAFAREFRNPLKGEKSYAMANTHDPRGVGNLVPNWAEVIALGKRELDGSITPTPLGFTLNFYSQSGELLDTRRFVLPGLGEFDYAAGHEYLGPDGKVIESVYLVEVIPDSPDAEYFLSVARYSSNAPAGVDPETYNYAVVLEGKTGSPDTLFAPIGNTIGGVDGLNPNVTLSNWVETACVTDTACRVNVLYRNAAGNVIATQLETYFPKGQQHYHAGALLPAGQTGTIELQVVRGRIFAQSMSYVHGELNELQSGFVSVARSSGRASQAGSVNTFLGMQNALQVTAIDVSSFDVDVTVNTFGSGSFSASLGLNSGGSSALSISSGGQLSVPKNTFGALLLDTPNDGLAVAEVRRVRLDAKGNVDFVSPTLIK